MSPGFTGWGGPGMSLVGGGNWSSACPSWNSMAIHVAASSDEHGSLDMVCNSEFYIDEAKAFSDWWWNFQGMGVKIYTRGMRMKQAGDYPNVW